MQVQVEVVVEKVCVEERRVWSYDLVVCLLAGVAWGVVASEVGGVHARVWVWAGKKLYATGNERKIEGYAKLKGNE